MRHSSRANRIGKGLRNRMLVTIRTSGNISAHRRAWNWSSRRKRRKPQTEVILPNRPETIARKILSPPQKLSIPIPAFAEPPPKPPVALRPRKIAPRARHPANAQSIRSWRPFLGRGGADDRFHQPQSLGRDSGFEPPIPLQPTRKSRVSDSRHGRKFGGRHPALLKLSEHRLALFLGDTQATFAISLDQDGLGRELSERPFASAGYFHIH